MYKYHLTFAIICYEKDYENALKTIEHIYEYKIPFSFEVLAIFNSNNFSVFEKFYTLAYEKFNKKKNIQVYQVKNCLSQYFARRKVITRAKGKYIWFIDGDDYIVNEIPRKFKFVNSDIICFNAFTKDLKYWCNGPSRKIKVKHKEYIEKTINFTLWNKWIKTKILKKIINHNISIVSAEDSIYCISSIIKAKSIKYFEDALYIYNKPKSIDTPICKDFYEFERLLDGNNAILSELKANGADILGYENLDISELSWYLRAAKYFSNSDLKLTAEFLNKEFSKEKIKKALELLPTEFSFIEKRLEYNGLEL